MPKKIKRVVKTVNKYADANDKELIRIAVLKGISTKKGLQYIREKLNDC